MSAKFPRGGGGYDHLADSLFRQETLENIKFIVWVPFFFFFSFFFNLRVSSLFKVGDDKKIRAKFMLTCIFIGNMLSLLRFHNFV